MKNRNCKLSAKLNSTPILKISSKSMNKCASLIGFLVKSILRLSPTEYRDMGNFVHFW